MGESLGEKKIRNAKAVGVWVWVSVVVMSHQVWWVVGGRCGESWMWQL